MNNFLVKLDTGILIALLGLLLEFYRQWLKSKDKEEQEFGRQIKEARESSRERTEIKKDLGFVREKITFILDWMSSNSSFR
jgi:hypothetical protein